MVAPNSARKMEPVRLSVPRAAAGPVTQRGRCGKLGDSQQYTHVQGQSTGNTTHRNLLGTN